MADGLGTAATHKRKDANLDVYQGPESTAGSMAVLANDCKTNQLKTQLYSCFDPKYLQSIAVELNSAPDVLHINVARRMANYDTLSASRRIVRHYGNSEQADRHGRVKIIRCSL